MQMPNVVLYAQVVSAAGVPHRDFLHKPRIAVGVGEGEEGAVARARWIGARKTCLRRERRPVPHVTRLDATADEFGMSRFDVADN